MTDCTEALLTEQVKEINAEIADVKAALRKEGGTHLGMGGKLLQEYLVELTKKENLLLGRAAYSPKSSPKSVQRAPVEMAFESSTEERGRATAVVHAPTPLRERSSSFERQKKEKERSNSTSSHTSAHAIVPTVPGPPDCWGPNGTPYMPLAQRRSQSKDFPPPDAILGLSLTHRCPSVGSSHSSSPHAAASPPSRPMPPPMLDKDQAAAAVKDMGEDLAELLQFIDTHAGDLHAQRYGIHAVGRISADKSKVRPLCIAAAGAVVRSMRSSSDLTLQIIAVTVLCNLVYDREVAALTASDIVPAVVSAMVHHADCERLQCKAREALARLAKTADGRVVGSLVQTALRQGSKSSTQTCQEALAQLRLNGIIDPSQILEAIVALTESQPADLRLQHQSALMLQRLAMDAVLDERKVKRAVGSVMQAQWAHILLRFSSARSEEQRLEGRFHARIQNLYHEEVAKHFQYEAAERTLHLLQEGGNPGPDRIREVVRCFVENLEDYGSRMDARESAWDAEKLCVVPLNAALRRRLYHEALDGMLEYLVGSLAFAGSTGGKRSLALLELRVSELRTECHVLLDRKTEATQSHQERMEELRREVMLFEAVEFLELHSSQVTATQLRTAFHMLDTVENEAPLDARDRLRQRLEQLAAEHALW